MKDIINQCKRHLKNKDIQTIWVPAYENLTLAKIGEFARQQPDIGSYFPDQPDLSKVPRQWIVNVMAAVIGTPFRDWVAACIEERNAEMNKKRDEMVAMDPDIAAAFQSSTHVSCKCSFDLRLILSKFVNSAKGRVCTHAQNVQQETQNEERDR